MLTLVLLAAPLLVMAALLGGLLGVLGRWAGQGAAVLAALLALLLPAVLAWSAPSSVEAAIRQAADTNTQAALAVARAEAAQFAWAARLSVVAGALLTFAPLLARGLWVCLAPLGPLLLLGGLWYARRLLGQITLLDFMPDMGKLWVVTGALALCGSVFLAAYVVVAVLRPYQSRCHKLAAN